MCSATRFEDPHLVRQQLGRTPASVDLLARCEALDDPKSAPIGWLMIRVGINGRPHRPERFPHFFPSVKTSKSAGDQRPVRDDQLADL